MKLYQVHEVRPGGGTFAVALVRLQRASMVFQVSGNNDIFPTTRLLKTILGAKVRRGQGTRYLSYSVTCAACKNLKRLNFRLELCVHETHK
eukprot:1156746-Pelagomonas_calceolata.AAC.7